MIPTPPSSAPTKSRVTFSHNNQPQHCASPLAGDDDSSTLPTWARRGISWRSVREVFDDDFVPDDEKTDDMIELEINNLNETMRKYATLYDEVGLHFLNDTCSEVDGEDVGAVRQQIHDQLALDRTRHSRQQEQKKPTGSVAFCFNCRESGHTHGVCTQPRRCYICHDPRHDAFVCVANPVAGSEFYDAEEKCAICGDRGHMSRRCKNRGGPWQGKPGYAHLPDTTYPRPLIIHTGRKTASSSGSDRQPGQSSSSSSNKIAGAAAVDLKGAREVILRLVQAYRPEDLSLMKLMREPELFCGSLPLLANQTITGVQRVALRQALDILRPSVAGVDLASFGVVLNEKKQGALGSGKKSTASRKNKSQSVNVLDDEAALNELRTSSVDFNVVFGNQIERYKRSESSAEFRVGLQKIQAKTGLKPSDISLYDDDEVAAKISKEVAQAADAARRAQARAMQLQKEIDRAGRSSSQATTTRTTSSATSSSSYGGGSRGSSPNTTNVTGTAAPSARRLTARPEPESAATLTPTMTPPTTVNAAATSSRGRMKSGTDKTYKKQSPTTTAASPAAPPLPPPATATTATTTKNVGISTGVFNGTGLRHLKTLDPAAAERKARSRREAAGEATLMRWTRLLSQGLSVNKVTSQEAASSTNTSLSKQELKAAAEDDLLRLMKAAVNKGDSNVIEGKRLSIPRIQHGTIGRDSIIRAWAEHTITPILAPATTTSLMSPDAVASNSNSDDKNSQRRQKQLASSSSREREADVPKNSWENSMKLGSSWQSKMNSSDNLFSSSSSCGGVRRADAAVDEFFRDDDAVDNGRSKAQVFMTEPPKSPTAAKHSNHNNSTGAGIRLQRRRQVHIHTESPLRSPTAKSPRSTAQNQTSTFPASSACEGRLNFGDDDNNHYNNQQQQNNNFGGDIDRDTNNKELATPRSNYRDNSDRVESTIRLPDSCKSSAGDSGGGGADEPIRNWNAHRVAMLWGKQQQNASANAPSSAGALDRKARTGLLHADKVDVWLHARDRFDRSVEDAKKALDEKIAWGGRREDAMAARGEFDTTMRRLGNPPPISTIIDPDVVGKWKGRFQTARIKAGVKDAAIKESRLVHRSVVASARLGGAAVCDGATKRAERWLRSHRDVESLSEGRATSLISDRSSMWTILCHRTAIAAVRLRAKRELAEELRAFLSRLPQKRATQDESIRMVDLFEEFVYGDDFADRKSKDEQREAEGRKMQENASFADLLFLKSVSTFPLSSFGSMKRNDSASFGGGTGNFSRSNRSNSLLFAASLNSRFEFQQEQQQQQQQRRTSTTPTATPKTVLDRCMEEWLLGNKRDEEKKRKKLQTSEEEAADRSKSPHYAQAKNIDSEHRKESKQDEERKRRELYSAVAQHQQHQHQQRKGTGSRPDSPLLHSSRTMTTTTAATASPLLTTSRGGIGGYASNSSSAATTPTPAFGSTVFSVSASEHAEMLLAAQQQRQLQGSVPVPSHTRSSDLERLLSAPVTTQDVERLIEKACRESYAHLHDSEELRRAIPAHVTVWATDDPRRSAPRTQEGECVAAFLRWIVSPAATEGAIGRIISKFTTRAGLFDFELAFQEVPSWMHQLSTASAEEKSYASSHLQSQYSSSLQLEQQKQQQQQQQTLPQTSLLRKEASDVSKDSRGRDNDELMSTRVGGGAGQQNITIPSVESSPTGSGALSF